MKASSAVAVFSVVVLLALAGCSADGTLVIWNNTNGDVIATIEGVDQTVATGAQIQQSWSLNYFPYIYDEDKSVQVTVEGLFKFPETLTQTVRADSTTELFVEADAGVITIENASGYYNIAEIYVALSTDTAWGDNWLTSSIAAGGTFLLRTNPGEQYDVLIGDDYANYWAIVVANGDTVPTMEADGLWPISWDGSYIYWDYSLTFGRTAPRSPARDGSSPKAPGSGLPAR